MKPAWNTAPKWAGYLTCEPANQWYWWEFKPKYDGHSLEWLFGAMKNPGRCRPVIPSPARTPENWNIKTIEARPT